MFNLFKILKKSSTVVKNRKLCVKGNMKDAKILRREGRRLKEKDKHKKDLLIDSLILMTSTYQGLFYAKNLGIMLIVHLYIHFFCIAVS